MLKEMIVMVAFLLSLSAIIASVVIIQKNSNKQMAETLSIMEAANEIN